MGRRARMRKLREEDLEELAEQLEAEPEKARRSAGPAKQAPGRSTRRSSCRRPLGNRAVGAVLSRWPGFGAPPVAQWPKEQQMIVDGTVIPIESFQRGGPSARHGHGHERQPEPKPGSSPVPARSSSCSRWASLGRPAPAGDPGPRRTRRSRSSIPTKDGKGIRFILTDVLISNYSISSSGDNPLESLALNFKKREFSQDPPPPSGRR